MKYLYLDGKEMQDGDLFTAGNKPNYAKVFVLYREEETLRYKNLTHKKLFTFYPESFVPLRNETCVKHPNAELLMRREEWLKLFDRLVGKINSTEFNLLECNYSIPQEFIDLWTKKTTL